MEDNKLTATENTVEKTGTEVLERDFIEVIPAVDMSETDEAYHLWAEIPGTAKENVELSVKENALHLKADAYLGNSGHNPVRYERSFTLGRGIDTARIEAHLENGVLEIKLAKQEEVKPRSISIQGE